MKKYEKHKNKVQKNLDVSLKILEHDKETEELILKNKLNKKEAVEFKEKRAYECMDKYMNSKYQDKNKDKKILVKRRKLKSNMKKKLETS